MFSTSRFLTAVSVAAITGNAASAALVAYWPLNDGTAGSEVSTAGDVIDDGSHPATDATSSGAGDTWVNDAERGIVYSTTATQHLNAGDQGIVGDFTWSLWVKTSDTSGNDIIMGNRNNSGNPWNKLTTHQLQNWATISPTGGWGVNDGQWHHMALQRSGTTVSVWVDGTQNPITATQANDFSGPLRLGGDAENWGESLTGLLSDIAIWNVALSADEIAGLADGSLTPLTIPEPASLALIGLGSLLIVSQRRRRA